MVPTAHVSLASSIQTRDHPELPTVTPLSMSSVSTSNLLDLEKQDSSRAVALCTTCENGQDTMAHVDLSKIKYLKLDNDPSTNRPIVTTELDKLLTLSLPVMLTYVLEILPEVVSIMLVGRMNSPLTKEYVDAATLSSMFISISGEAPGLGLATALDTLCSQANGSGKPKHIGISFQTGLVVLTLACIPIFWINYYTTDVLQVMKQPTDVAQLAGQFSRCLLPGLPFLFLYELLKKVLQAQNIVKPMVGIAILSNMVNLVLGIYLTWYTSLGFEGAAIARSLSNMVLPLATIPYFFYRPEHWTMWWPGWQPHAVWTHIHDFLSLGIPGMFMVVLEWFSYDILSVLVAFLPNSVVAISVHSVLSNIANLASRLFMGVGVATNVLVGNYVGSGQHEHAQLCAHLGVLTGLVLALVLVFVITLSHHVLPMIFINDEDAIELASFAILSLIPFELLDAVNCVMQGVFSGTGRQTFAASANLLCYFIVGLPCGALLAYRMGYGVEGFWLGLTFGYMCSATISAYTIWQTKWDLLTTRARERADSA